MTTSRRRFRTTSDTPATDIGVVDDASAAPLSTPEVSPPKTETSARAKRPSASIPPAQTFKAAYEQLDHVVQRLRETGVENIDDLVPLVEEATQAYKACKERLDAVEKLLGRALDATDNSSAE